MLPAHSGVGINKLAPLKSGTFLGVTNKVLVADKPQLTLTDDTPIFPELAPAMQVIKVSVLVPVQPEGKVQAYELALATRAMV